MIATTTDAIERLPASAGSPIVGLALDSEEDAGKLATRSAMGSSEDMTWPTPQYAFPGIFHATRRWPITRSGLRSASLSARISPLVPA